MPDAPLFECLEGLRGTGKSTVAPLLAAARGAVLIPTVPAVYQPLRRHVDRGADVDARMCFYLSAVFTAADEIQRHLAAGTPVVVESYFARCLANHKALGARLVVALPDGLTQPTSYFLTCADDERRRRLGARDKPNSRWDDLVETVCEQVVDAYASFPMRRIDTTGLAPAEVVRAITATSTEGSQSDADSQSLGARPLLPPVPRRAEGAPRP
jgi:predicted kinase